MMQSFVESDGGGVGMHKSPDSQPCGPAALAEHARMKRLHAAGGMTLDPGSTLHDPVAVGRSTLADAGSHPTCASTFTHVFGASVTGSPH
jgi:hypothetical protein